MRLDADISQQRSISTLTEIFLTEIQAKIEENITREYGTSPTHHAPHFIAVGDLISHPCGRRFPPHFSSEVPEVELDELLEVTQPSPHSGLCSVFPSAEVWLTSGGAELCRVKDVVGARVGRRDRSVSFFQLLVLATLHIVRVKQVSLHTHSAIPSLLTCASSLSFCLLPHRGGRLLRTVPSSSSGDRGGRVDSVPRSRSEGRRTAKGRERWEEGEG